MQYKITIIVLVFLTSVFASNPILAENQTKNCVCTKDEKSSQNDLTTVVSIVGIFGVIGALIFNTFNQITQNKNKHYQVLKDFDEEYVKLVEIGVQLQDFVFMPFNQLIQQSPEIVRDVQLFRWKYLAFHERIAHLALTDIISKAIAQYYALAFGIALIYIDLDQDPERTRRELNYTVKWCDNENIKKAEGF